MKNIEYGIFMPVGSGGWIPSVNVPEMTGTYESNLEVALLSEKYDFDFTLSQSGWRGWGGPSKHWDVNLESLTTSAGLAQATSKIGVWSTVNMTLIHPGYVAKILATQDQISHGRSGLNVVAGGNRFIEQQMGPGLDLDSVTKYRRCTEWVEILKALWTEDRVDYDGEFFTLVDCESWPKPASPPPLISAATSDAGLAFTAKNLDGVLWEGTSRESVIRIGQRTRRIAEEHGGKLKSYCVWMIIPGDTDADAHRRIQHYIDGRDEIALANLRHEWGSVHQEASANNAINEDWANTLSVTTGTVAGSPETIAEQLADQIENADIDGAVFIMPDFIEDLTVLGEEIVPRLVKGGFGRVAA